MRIERLGSLFFCAFMLLLAHSVNRGLAASFFVRDMIEEYLPELERLKA